MDKPRHPGESPGPTASAAVKQAHAHALGLWHDWYRANGEEAPDMFTEQQPSGGPTPDDPGAGEVAPPNPAETDTATDPDLDPGVREGSDQ